MLVVSGASRPSLRVIVLPAPPLPEHPPFKSWLGRGPGPDGAAGRSMRRRVDTPGGGRHAEVGGGLAGVHSSLTGPPSGR